MPTPPPSLPLGPSKGGVMRLSIMPTPRRELFVLIREAHSVCWWVPQVVDQATLATLD